MDHDCDCKVELELMHPHGWVVTEECFRCAVKRVVAERRARRVRRLLLASICVYSAICAWALGRIVGAW